MSLEIKLLKREIIKWIEELDEFIKSLVMFPSPKFEQYQELMRKLEKLL